MLFEIIIFHKLSDCVKFTYDAFTLQSKLLVCCLEVYLLPQQSLRQWLNLPVLQEVAGQELCELSSRIFKTVLQV